MREALRTVRNFLETSETFKPLNPTRFANQLDCETDEEIDEFVRRMM